MNRKRNFFLIVLLFGLLQVCVLQNFRLFGVKPDLLLIAVIAASLMFEVEFALPAALLCGAFKDLFGVHVFGLNAFLMPLAAFLVIKLSRKIALDDIPVLCVSTFVIAIAYDLAGRIILGRLCVPAPFWASARVIFFGSVYTAAVFPPALRLIKKTACL